MTRYLIAAAALALLVGACSSSSKSSSTTTGPSGATTTTNPLSSIGAASVTGMTLSLARGPQGIFLIGPQGHALYTFTKDTGTTSACTSSGCAKTWPAFTAVGTLSEGPGVNVSQVGTATGQAPNQVTYYGHLLYYFSGDAAPGDTNGEGIANSWYLLGPVGNEMLPR